MRGYKFQDINMAFLLGRCRYDMAVVDALTASVDTDNVTNNRLGSKPKELCV